MKRKKVFSIKRFIATETLNGNEVQLNESLKSGWPQKYNGLTMEEIKAAGCYALFPFDDWMEYVFEE